MQAATHIIKLILPATRLPQISATLPQERLPITDPIPNVMMVMPANLLTRSGSTSSGMSLGIYEE